MFRLAAAGTAAQDSLENKAAVPAAAKRIKS
jgi:hypothetical protein